MIGVELKDLIGSGYLRISDGVCQAIKKLEAVGCQQKKSFLEVGTASQPMRMVRADKPCVYILQGTLAALPPFGGTETDHLPLNTQKYLTPGCQVLGGYDTLGTLPDMISSPGSHFAVIEHIKII